MQYVILLYYSVNTSQSESIGLMQIRSKGAVLCLSVITAGMGGQSSDLENLFQIAISHLIIYVMPRDFFNSFDLILCIYECIFMFIHNVIIYVLQKYTDFYIFFVSVSWDE